MRGSFESGGGDIFLDQLPGVVGESDDLVEFVGSGVDVGSNIEGAGDRETAFEFVDCTTGTKPGTLVWGGHRIHP